MRSAIAVSAAFIAGALAVPHAMPALGNKRPAQNANADAKPAQYANADAKPAQYATAYDIVYVTDVVTVTYGGEPAKKTPEHQAKHYGHHNHHPAANAKPTNPPSVPKQAPEQVYSAPQKAYQPPSSQVEIHIQASSTPVSTPDTTIDAAPSEYSDLVVYHHNLHRSNHSCEHVTWSDELYSSAKEVAESCVYAHNTEAQGGGYGQNIAAGVEASNVSAIITDLFYNGEEPYFASEYGKADPDMTFFEKWGHFTQIVWKGTTEVACYTQHCPGGLANVGSDVQPYFTVCNYKGPGNYAGEYAENVPAPMGKVSASWNSGASK